MPKITLNNITVVYKEKKSKTLLAALYKANCNIPNHSYTAVTGSSGSGKSTFLKAISGLLPVQEGSIFFDSIDVTPLSIKKRNISFVTQNITLYPNMTVFDNIAYPLKVMKLPPSEILSRVKNIAKSMNISLFLSRKPRVLSQGQQQLVVLAKALIKNPDILLLDEPFANLDLPKKKIISQLIYNYYKEMKINVIHVTHSKDNLLNIADHFLLIENGEIFSQ